jgi:hypothetical protein
MRVSAAETTSLCASVFIGQTEASLTIKPYIERMTEAELMAVMIGVGWRTSPARRCPPMSACSGITARCRWSSTPSTSLPP